MKNIVRALVIAFTLTGAAASSYAHSTFNATTNVGAKASALPVPMCPPDDPNACGIGR